MQADPGVPLGALEIDRSIHNAAESPRSVGIGLLYCSNPCSTLLYSDANTAKRTWPISIKLMHTKHELLYRYWSELWSYGDESSVFYNFGSNNSFALKSRWALAPIQTMRHLIS